MELEFTGERVVPGKVEPYLYYEHISRYYFAMQRTKPHHQVLDLGCGAGYGTYELARVAGHATGVDISGEAVEYAKERYALPNLDFFEMDCANLAFEPSRFDRVVSFEVIEHVPDVHVYLQQVKHVLNPDGMLIVSTPNKRVYTDPYEYSNPFHIKEYYYDEFKELLQAYFRHVTLHVQEYIHGIAIRGLAAQDQVGHISSEHGERNPEAAPYFVAECSDAAFEQARELHFTFEAPIAE